MNEQKSLLTYLGEALDRYRAARHRPAQEQASPKRSGWLRALLPTPGNVLFTLLVVAGLIWANSVGALPLRTSTAASTSTGTIAYQGRLADADGTPITDTVNMEFRLYNVASGGIFLWEEQWTGSNGAQVSDGLFNVMLGSLTPIPQSVITGHDTLFLGITVGTDDEMTPRVQLGSVPFAVQALTVPDGSVTTEKIADEAVTQAKLGADVSMVPPDGSVTTEKLADGAVTDTKVNLTQLTLSGDIQGNVVRATSQVQVQFPVSSGSAPIGPGNLVEAIPGEPGYVRLPTGANSRYIVGVTGHSAGAGGTVWVIMAGITTVTSQTTIHAGEYVCNGGSPAPGQVVPCGSSPPQGSIVGIALNETSPGAACHVLLE